MQAERDYLRDFVCPELAERLRPRRCALELIDLRWGVDTSGVSDQEGKESTVLKVCLDEIDRCRPFLIVLLGDRYGWVPPAQRAAQAALERGFPMDVTGKSVTAMEIEYGVLTKPEVARSYFYLRSPLPYTEMDPQVSQKFREAAGTDSDTRLEALKTRIRHEYPLRFRGYASTWDPGKGRITGLAEFGRMVIEDFWREFDVETKGAVAEPTHDDPEEEALEEFRQDRASRFAGRTRLLEELERSARVPAGQGGIFCLQGPSGSGKSSILARLSEKLSECKDCIVLTHAAGLTPSSTSVDAMLLRWAESLSRLTGDWRSGLFDHCRSLEDKVAAFEDILTKASLERRVVCLVDGLNLFERSPAARHLTWIPSPWPRDAVLIATTVPGEESAAMSLRKDTVIVPVPDLSRDDAGEIIDLICSRWHKRLDAATKAALLAKRDSDGRPAFSSPLWLSLAAEQLLLFDEDDFARAEDFSGTPEERLLQLLTDTAKQMPARARELYAWTFERAGRILGPERTIALLSLIAASRGGLRPIDLAKLVGQSVPGGLGSLDFAAFRRYFRAHLTYRGPSDTWDFHHTLARQAALEEFSTDARSAVGWHRAIASHLVALDRQDPFRGSELVFHCFHAGMTREAADYLSGLLSEDEANLAAANLRDLLTAACTDEVSPSASATSVPLAGITREITSSLRYSGIPGATAIPEAAVPGRQVLDWIVSMLAPVGGGPAGPRELALCRRFSGSLMSIAKDSVPIETKRFLMDAVLSSLEAIRPKTSQEASVGDIEYGDALTSVCKNLASLMGEDSTGAREHLIRSLRYWEALSEKQAGDGEVSRRLRRAYIDMGDFVAASTRVQQRRELDAVLSRVRLGSLLDVVPVPDPVAWYEKAVAETKRAVFGPQGEDLESGVLIVKMGRAWQAAGEARKALACYEEALASHAEADPAESASPRILVSRAACLRGLAGLLLETEPSRAATSLRRSVALAAEAVRMEPWGILGLQELAACHEAAGDAGLGGSAAASYTRAVSDLERLARLEPDTAHYKIALGNVFEKLGDDAARTQEAERALIRGVSESKPWRVSILPEIDTARAWYDRALRVREGLLAADPGDPTRLKNLLESYMQLARLFILSNRWEACRWAARFLLIASRLHLRANAGRRGGAPR